MKDVLILVLLFVLYSCEKTNGEVIEYDINGKVISKSFIKDKNNFDSIYFFKDGLIFRKVIFNEYNKNYIIKNYDKDQHLISEGPAIDSIKIGIWHFYNIKNEIVKKVEFKKICSSEYPNQEYTYQENRKINISKSSFYQYSLKEIFHDSRKYYNININYVPLLKNKSSTVLFFSTEIDKDFCNVDSIRKDTVPSSGGRFNFLFNVAFKTKGNKNVRGYISEYYYEDTSNKKFVEIQERRVFFDIPIVSK